jgi:arylsulfatase A-like enzyme
LRGWLARPVLSIAGAVVGAAFIASLEAVKASREWRAPLGQTVLADVAVLVPVATVVGLGVAAALMTLDPEREWTLGNVTLRLRALRDDTRSRLAAITLLAPVAALAWVVISAHVARAVLLRDIEAWVAGAAMGAMSLLVLAMSGCAVIALAPATARALPARLGPVSGAACGALLAAGGMAAGIHLGDPSGNGRTPLAILGVLARRELDLSPLFGLFVVALGATLGERASRESRWGRVVVAGVVAVGAWGLVVQQAHAMAEDPGIAYPIEHGAPLGRVGLAMARKATDRDHDGASYLFGGADCDDADPRRSPTAIDVPGNGIDEDCSGADLPKPRPPPVAKPSARAAVPRDLNLVLVTVDTLRIDLGFMGYPRPVSPNLDALAARSTVFDHAYSMASYTGKSVGPTMIGKYPCETLRDGAHFDTYFDDNTLLAERLRTAGFRTMGVASHWYFKPKYGLSQGMDVWDMSAMPPESGGDTDSSVTSEGLTDAAVRLLSDRANTSQRFFLWVHYFDPHANYVPHAEAPDFRAGAKNWAKPFYDGEVWFTDHHIGRLLDFIASQPWSGRTAIVVTSDHGEAFDEHGMSYHGVDLWEPVVRVPLVVYVPGAKPHRVKQKRSLVDLVPTLLDLMGLPAPPAGELSGESNAAAIVSPDEVTVDERDVYMDMPAGPEVSQHRAIIHGPTPGMKLMSEGGPVFLLYDLSRDEAEVDELSRRERPALARMMSAFGEKLSSLHEIHTDPAPYKAR